MEKHSKYLIHTDGGSRGNPGPAAVGAVIFALKKLKQLAGKEEAEKATIEFHVDSELLVRQLGGQYQIVDDKIQKLFLEIWNLKLDFGEVTFKHVPREENKEADRRVNYALDKELNKLL